MAALMYAMVVLSGGSWQLFFGLVASCFQKNPTPKSLWVCGYSTQQKVFSAAFGRFVFVFVPGDWELFTLAHRVSTAAKLPSTKN